MRLYPVKTSDSRNGRPEMSMDASVDSTIDRTGSGPDLDDRSLYINREMSLLAFQERVLEEAEDESAPLLERAKFLAIFSSNMAEFYMVRVAGLRQQVLAGVSELSLDGLTPAEQ